MLRSRLFNISTPRRCISYFSNEFNNLADRTPASIPGSLQSNDKNQMTTNLGVFVNQENRQLDIIDLLLKLRKQKESSLVPLFPGILVKSILESSSPQELIGVLRNPLQYGVFIDEFSGCYLMDKLLHNGYNLEAAQIASLVINRNLDNNEAVYILCLQSYYAFLKDYVQKPIEPKKDVAPPPPAAEVEKVRVKFLRNYEKVDPSLNTEEQILGRTLLQLTANGTKDDGLKVNFALLGYALCNRTEEIEKLLSQNQQDKLYKEILELTAGILKHVQGEKPSDASVDAINQLIQNNNSQQQPSIDEVLKTHIVKSIQINEPKMITEYLTRYEEWTKSFENAINAQLEKQNLATRVDGLKTVLDELQTKRQNLWFFENKDDIDIQIFKKKVYYPKRWFGKKKKPKAIDTHYVPPEITRNTN